MRQRSRGWTLVEMLVVLVILSTVAGLVTVNLGGVVERSQDVTTSVSMAQMRDAIVGSRQGGTSGCYLADLGRVPATIADLFRLPSGASSYDIATGIGWRGPYLTTSTGRYELNPPSGFVASYGTLSDPCILDGWSRPIVLQVPDPDGDGITGKLDQQHARLVSAGPNGILETPMTTSAAALPGSSYFPLRVQCGDDLLLYLLVADTRN